MGDLFFFIKMVVFTVVLVLILQVKVGSSTLEEKVMDWTHQSEFSTVIQGVADSAVHAIGVGYNRVRGTIKSRFSEEHSDGQIPGGRIKSTIDNSRAYLRKKFGEGKTLVEPKEQSSSQSSDNP